ncbi:MAG: LysR family transcriptional regulator [Proteobacteria bacterium]|nr:LysR family transcriptional regulator [Pseudomonadota bacterium]
MDRMTAMEVFVRVAELQSFSGAAQDMNMGTPSVSKYVASLEERIGTRLFNRTTRTLSLTEAGQTYYTYVRNLLQEFEEAELAAASRQLEPKGTLRLSAPMSFGKLHLGPALAKFVERYPDLTIDLSLSDTFVDIVGEGYDMAIRIGGSADSSLISKKIASSGLVVCASPRYLQTNGTPKTPADLAHHDCLHYSYLTTQNVWVFQKDEQEYRVTITPKLRANNGEVLTTAAEHHLGIVMQPCFIIAESVTAGRLVPILTDYCPQRFNINAVYPHRTLVSSKVRVLTEFLTEYFGITPNWDKQVKGHPHTV